MREHWIYLSPHLDDAVLSCGGLIWEQVQAGHQVEVWTICAGDPPPGERPPFALSLEQRWQTGTASVAARRLEDKDACARLGAQITHFDLPDCIYRRLPNGNPLVNNEDDLWQPLSPEQEPLVEQVSSQITAALPDRCNLVAPLALGDHIDHRLVRAAALCLKRDLFFYADYPYAAHPDVDIHPYIYPTWQQEHYSISEPALQAWQDAITLYPSQISSLWNGLEEMINSLQKFFNQGGGGFLWRKPE
jgi:LmbE family N-acetylglucosaminyl deacetylase